MLTPPAAVPGGLGAWTATADYPPADACSVCAPICVTNAGYVYCISNAGASAFYSQLTADGPGRWMPTTANPVQIDYQSCAVDSDTIYCVGGRLATGATADVYSAALSPDGIGPWTASTPFPRTGTPTCVTDSGYIYCTYRYMDWSTSYDASYYAPVSPSGVGAWMPTPGPPSQRQGCVAVNGYAYCYGGGDCSTYFTGDCYSASYFAPLTAAGFGPWQATTQLPTTDSGNSVAVGSYIYHLSTPAFFASVSADGIGPWQTTTVYPDSIDETTCFSGDDDVYCTGQQANSSYFAQVGAADPNGIQLENPPPFPRSQYFAPDPIDGPQLDDDIRDAIIFDCGRSQAATPAGCSTPLAGQPSGVSIRYPCSGATSDDANCCFTFSPGTGWCSWVGPSALIIAEPLTLGTAESP